MFRYGRVIVVWLLALVLGACSVSGTPVPAETAVPPPPAATVTAVPPTPDMTTAPEEVVTNFYTWYLDLIGERGSADFIHPLNAGLYRQSDLLTAAFKTRIDDALAELGEQGGYDPILQAQDVPESVEVQTAVVDGDRATVVMLRFWGGNPDPSPMVVELVGENGRWLIDATTPFEIPQAGPEIAHPDAPNSTMTPDEIVQTFYDWYLDLAGRRGRHDFVDPIAGGIYRDSPYLDERFIRYLDELAAGEPGGFDPILLAQDVPVGFMAYAPIPEGGQLRVPLVRYWSGGTDPDHIFVYLRQQDGVWLISDVLPGELYTPGSSSPESTVQTFYDWYTTQVRRRFVDDTVTADFHDSPLLSDSYKEHLDETIAAAEAANPGMGLHMDPILCAQDVPVFVTPLAAFVVEDTAVLTARTSFPNQVVVVSLRRGDDDAWLISDINCKNDTVTIVRAFYAGYLGYMGDRSSATARNPLVDMAYRWQPLLSPTLIAAVENMAGPEGGYDHDPFLLAQNIPSNFSVDPGVVEGTAVVHFTYGPDSVVHVLVQVTNGQISAIERADPLPTEAP